jgi:ABC-type lipoprotein release transport system permease subunit
MTLLKIAWRNLFRQRRRTLITCAAMALSLLIAIPTYGLMEGLTAQMLRGITRMDLGHIQIHDPAYPRSRALQSTLRRPSALLERVRHTEGVVAAAPRVHGYGLASHETLLSVALTPLPSPPPAVRFGRSIASEAPWRQDPALPCEAVVALEQAREHAITVGTVLTPRQPRAGDSCERLRVVGLLTPRSTDAPQPSPLRVYIAADDLQRVFGLPSRQGQAVVLHSAAIEISGIDPPEERRITFIAEKLISGRYLEPTSRDEVLVGYRLAQIMRLQVGDELFVQAGTLDYSSNRYYQDLRVVGIYRTGVEMIDRSRVFVGLRDAQQLMGLGQRVHEIAIVGSSPRKLDPLLERLRDGVSKTRIRVTTQSVGRRAGSAPLPAPVTLFEPTRTGDDAALLIPYDLKRRFDDLPQVAAIARRVYARTEVRSARAVSVDIQAVAAERLPPAARRPCHLLLPSVWATRWSVKNTAIVVPELGEADSLSFCPEMVAWVGPAPRAPVPSTPPALLFTAQRATSAGQGAPPSRVPTGQLQILVSSSPRPLRVAGIEYALEPRLNALPSKLASGTYFLREHESSASAASSGPDGSLGKPVFASATPVLVPQRVAKTLGSGPGNYLLLRARDDEGQVRWSPARISGLLRDSDWPATLPELVLPYFAAQQLDAPRLNARAHEMILLPTDGAHANALARNASRQLAPLIRSWQQIAPDMAKLLRTQDAWTGIFLLIIFAIAAMTVMNTMLMAVFERTKEFGVLKSIGMRPRQVFALITLETLSLALLAVTVGGGAGALLNHYLMTHGLDLSSYTGGFTYQGTFIDPVWRSLVTVRSIATPSLMVALVCLAVSLYPAIRAARLRPVEALRTRL